MTSKVSEVKQILDTKENIITQKKLLMHMKGLLDAVHKIEHIQNSEDTNTGQVAYEYYHKKVIISRTTTFHFFSK